MNADLSMQRPASTEGGCKLILVRHGHSHSQREGILTVDGITVANPRLTNLGMEQARLIAACLDSEKSAVLFVSPLFRAQQTATPLLAALNKDSVVLDNLREIYLGDWEHGELESRLTAGDPHAQRIFAEERWEIAPNAESGDSFAKRIEEVLSRIVERLGSGGVGVVFTHAAVIAEVCRQATGSRRFAFLPPDHGSITRIDSDRSGKLSLRSFNSISHLSGRGFARAADPDVAPVLSMIIRDMEGLLLPAVSGTPQQFVGEISVKLLRYLRDLEAKPELWEQEVAATTDASKAMASALKKRQEGNASLADALELADPASTELQLRLSEAAKVLVTAGDSSIWQVLVSLGHARLRRLQGGVLRSLNESFAEAGAGAAGARKEASDPMILNAIGLETVVRKQHGMASARVSGFKSVGTGSQKSIFLAVVQTGSGSSRELVLRQDKGYSAFDLSVVDEYPLLEALAKTSIPVPPPLWIGQGESLGYPVYATERLCGSADYMSWLKNTAVAVSVGLQTAAIMSAVHLTSVNQKPRIAAHLPGTVGKTPRDRVAHMAAYSTSMHHNPSPLIDACLTWLDKNAPTRIENMVPIHGDFGLHNILVDGVRITGLLDWEFAHVGDAHEDLSYIHPFIVQMMPWSDYTSAYRDHGGDAIDADLMHWWGVMGMLRLALGCQRNVQVVRDGRERLDIRVANQGYNYAAQLLQETVKKIAQGVVAL